MVWQSNVPWHFRHFHDNRINEWVNRRLSWTRTEVCFIVYALGNLPNTGKGTGLTLRTTGQTALICNTDHNTQRIRNLEHWNTNMEGYLQRTCFALTSLIYSHGSVF